MNNGAQMIQDLMDNPSGISSLPQNPNAMAELTSMLAGMFKFIAILVVVAVAIKLIELVATCMIFKKANRPWWFAIVPFFNQYVMYDISTGKPLLFLPGFLAWICSYLVCNPVGVGVKFLAVAAGFLIFAGRILNIYKLIALARSFGKGIGFAIGLIFLPTIFMCILAFGSTEYVDDNREIKHKKTVSAKDGMQMKISGTNKGLVAVAAPQPPEEQEPVNRVVRSINRACPRCGEPLKISKNQEYYVCYQCQKKYRRSNG